MEEEEKLQKYDTCICITSDVEKELAETNNQQPSSDNDNITTTTTTNVVDHDLIDQYR
jgi:hypothetical protein